MPTNSSLRFTEGGWEGGPDLQTQNYIRIDIISIQKLNSSRDEVSPSPLRGGGARGWVPIEGARIFCKNNGEVAKNSPREVFCYFQTCRPICRCASNRRRLFEAHIGALLRTPLKKLFEKSFFKIFKNFCSFAGQILLSKIRI